MLPSLLGAILQQCQEAIHEMNEFAIRRRRIESHQAREVYGKCCGHVARPSALLER